MFRSCNSFNGFNDRGGDGEGGNSLAILDGLGLEVIEIMPVGSGAEIDAIPGPGGLGVGRIRFFMGLHVAAKSTLAMFFIIQNLLVYNLSGTEVLRDSILGWKVVCFPSTFCYQSLHDELW